MHNYEGTFNSFPPGRTTVSPEHSWTAFMLPYLEQDNVFKIYDIRKDWDDPGNYPAIQTQLSVFNCPSVPAGLRTDDTIAANPACGDYSTISAIHPFVSVNCFPGNGITRVSADNSLSLLGALVKDQKTRIEDILDGTSNTIMVAEDAGRSPLYVQGQVLGKKTVAGWKEGGWADPARPSVLMAPIPTARSPALAP